MWGEASREPHIALRFCKRVTAGRISPCHPHNMSIAPMTLKLTNPK